MRCWHHSGVHFTLGLCSLTHCEVLSAMPRSRMHDAASLLQRDMLAERSGNDSIEKWMLKLSSRKDAARKELGTGAEPHSCLLLDATHHLFSDYVGIALLIRD